MNLLFRTESWEKMLLRDLEDTQSSAVRFSRPVVDFRRKVRLRFRVGLIKLELDEKEKRLTLSTWTKYVSCSERKAFDGKSKKSLTVSTWAKYVSCAERKAFDAEYLDQIRELC